MATVPSKFDRLPKTLAGVREFNASKGILISLIGALLYYAHAAFVPIALALLFGLILSSPVEALHRAGVRRSISAVLILVVALAGVAGIVALMWTPAQQWYASAPSTLTAIQKKITPVARLMSHLDELTSRAGAVGYAVHPAAPSAAQAAPAVAERASATVLATVRSSALGLASFIITTLFLLAGGPPMVARMTAAFFDHLKANHVLRLIEKVRAEVGQFYVTTALINLGLGVATTLLMMAWGMPTPYLWGTLSALFSFIPYAGPAATLLLLGLVALVSFPGVGAALGVTLSYAALATLEGQLIQPLLVGRRLEVNPLLVFLGLWFGGIFWGVAGVVLATPALVALKVIAEHSHDGHSMLQFLGPNEPESPRYSKLRKLAGRSPSP